jgi:hypothetical protein
MLTGYYAVCHRFWTGDQAGGATLLDALRSAGEARDASPLARIIWHTLDAIRLWHQAATDACLKTVAQGQAIAEETGVRIWDFQLVAQGVFAALTASDLGTARGFLERMARVLATSRRLDVSLYHYLAGWEAILALDVPRARDHAEQGLKLTIEMGTPFPEGLNRLSTAQVLHEPASPTSPPSTCGAARRSPTTCGAPSSSSSRAPPTPTSPSPWATMGARWPRSAR